VTTPVTALVSLAAALVATPLAMVVARRYGVLDRPGALKSQAEAVPYLGGVGVFIALAVGVLAARPSLLIPLAGALALGVADDRFDIPAPARLAGEVVIGVAVVVTCPLHLAGWAGVMLVVPVTVLLINGVNLLDGLDLLAGGVVAVAAVGFALLLHGGGRQVAVALAAGLVGFLVFNRPPARIYLGDGGAYLMGTSLAVLLAGAWAPGTALTTGAAALALVAVPAAEVAFAVLRRLRGRRALMAGDRGHPYDQLVARGWPPLLSSLAYVAVQTVVTVAAVLVARHSSLPAAVTVDVLCAGILVGLAAATGALSPDQEART
jgi:UDP-GlcNAc:undecaprenyl-phosphate GlcNAc-1-phosphate transferase